MNRKLLYFTVLMLVAPITMFAQITGVLSGKVSDSKGEGVPGATVRVQGTTQGGISKADGRYTIAGIRAGDYEIKITAIGYAAKSYSVRISANLTTELNATLSSDAKRDTVIITGGGIERIKPERTGTVQAVTQETMDKTPRNSIISAIELTSSASSVGQNGVGIRGSRATETSIKIDGVEITDPINGGTGNTNAGLFPTVSTLAVQETQVVSSSIDAQYGDVLSGVVNTVTRSGRNDRYEGQFNYRTNLPFLYGSSSPITVKVAGSDRDTTLPGYQYQSSGSQLYEFAFGGPIPGTSSVTFFLTGQYNPYSYFGGGYEVHDMSNEYAAARAGFAQQLWGYSLSPQNLGQQPNREATLRNINAKFKADVTNQIYVELGGEVGLTTRELGAWTKLYLLDNPVTSRGLVNGVEEFDTATTLLERDMQSQDENTIIQRLNLRYFQNITESSFFEVTGSYVTNKNELGKKDESKDYQFWESYDIYQPVDADENIAVDRYEVPTQERFLNQFLDDPLTLPGRNRLTGLYEGPESPGASRNPYGINDLNFPTHGNDGVIDFNETTTITLRGNYETNFDLGTVRSQVKAGFDFSHYTLRKISNSLPWDQNPFFDVYGYDATYFSSKDITGRLREYLMQPYNPIKGALYVSSSFDYKSIVFQPGVRFDFFNPNTQATPLVRNRTEDVLDAINNGENASMKFQVSPRLGVSYPITEQSQFRVSFAMVFKMPELSLLYSNAYGDAQRGNQLFGNPDIDPQKVFMYEIGYTADFADYYNIDVSAFYRDIFNQSGVTYVPALPSPYIIYTVQEYGNVRGLEITARRSLIDNVSAQLNYTLQRAVGTASSPADNYSTLIGSPDPYTGEPRTVPLTEFPLSYDQTHNLNATIIFAWGEGQGPSIGGMKLLENTDLSFTGTFGTGLPYTRYNTRGQQVGEYNAERSPSSFRVEGQLQRGFLLKDLLGEAAGDLELTIYLQVYNLLNDTDPVAVYNTTGSPDNNGTSLDRQLGDFTPTTYYREIDPARPETYSTLQYDRFGERFYNPYSDTNLDGIVTQLEKYEGYQRFVATFQSLRSNYGAPRTFSGGFKIRF